VAHPARHIVANREGKLCSEDPYLFENAIDALDFAARVYMRVRSRIMLVKIGETFFGAKMYCDTKDFIQRRVYYFNMFEPNLSHYILGLVKPGDHVLDVGANVGYMTLLLSSIVGNSGRVVAIEAAPATYEMLLRNLQLNETSNVVPLNVAATNEACTVELITGEKNNSGTNSIRRTAGNGSVTVKGDALSKMNEIDHDKIKFIKIDVEGSEAPIIQDIVDTLAAYPRLQSIAVELTPSSSHLLTQLQNKGFRAYSFPNDYRIGYFFVRKYLRQSHEDGFVVKNPVDVYDPAYRDYIFERPASIAPSSELPGTR
jgi:FkbM family methyltransferase